MAEKTLQPLEKETMRMAMIRHEQAFKQQVSELHRLYRIQKIMMKDVENRRRKLELLEPAEEYVSAIVESELELTLGPSSSSHCRRKQFETKLASDSDSTLSSSSINSSNIYRAFNGDQMKLDVDEKMRGENLRQFPWAFQIVSL